ncbi:hypothetical protein [Microbacterium sp. NPDC058345]|uniref:hypothetical protein n=1 Tax=Microbacterium sp. NPDC058345 TaxID=3346455 RepID=UPI00366694D8
MLDETDAARRRELQRRAFAPGDALTAAEVAELRELDARRHAPAAPPDSRRQSEPPHPAYNPDPVYSPEPEAEPARKEAALGPALEPIPEPALEPAKEPALEPTITRQTGDSRGGRRGRLLLTLAVVAAALLGFAGGWLLPIRPADAAPAMTAEQREQFTQIETSGEYDPGSVRFAGAKHGASVWSATRDDGARECIVLRFGEKSAGDCYTREQIESWGGGAGAQMQVSVDGELVYLTASVLQGISGEPVTVIQRMASDGSWRDRFSEGEVVLAEVLVDAGVDANQLQIVGYDDDTPVWLTADGDACLLVVDPVTHDTARGCGGLDAQDPLVLALPEVSYSLRWHSPRGPLLTVIRQAASITCDVDTGYCATVDDTTGEIG